MSNIHFLEDVANRLRIHSIRSTSAAGSGHPTSCASAAEVMSALFFDVMHYDVEQPRNPNSDRFVLSKGHAAPVLYAAWAEAGLFPVTDLLKLRTLHSDLEGHPTPRLSFIDVATGSLGQGINNAVGMAYVGKHIEKAPYRVYCLLGDGECAEGSVWEAFAFAAHYKLDNLVAILDINRLGQSQPTSLQHEIDTYRRRTEAFGFRTIVIEKGNDMQAVLHALEQAEKVEAGRPTVLIARTFKGAGIPGIEDGEDWHGKPLGNKSDESVAALRSRLHNQSASIDSALDPNFKPKPPRGNELKPASVSLVHLSEPPAYKLGQEVATRAAYGTALVKLGRANPTVIALDADVKNSTFSIKFRDAFPDRFIECFIAEQNMVGVAAGCATRLRTIPFASTFACFLMRGFDQIRMGAISQSNTKYCGSHSGVSIGEDGPSQMALEDLAAFRSINNCVVFYPSDAVSCERAVELAGQHEGAAYIRTSRPNTPVLYPNDEPFAIGRMKLLRSNTADRCTIVAAGITLHEALRAAQRLEKEASVHVRIVDAFCLKPLDVDLLVGSAIATSGRVVTVEDHYMEGGLGEAVLGALATAALPHRLIAKRLAVRILPRSAKPNECLALSKIDAQAIFEAVMEVISIN